MVLGSAWVVLRINNLVIIIFIAVISIIVAIIVAVIIIVTVVIIMLSRPASVVATVRLLDLLDHQSTARLLGIFTYFRQFGFFLGNLLGLTKIKRDSGPLCVVVDDLVVVEPINILRRLQSLWSVELLVMVMRMVMTTTMMTTIMVTLEPAKVVENLWGYFF